MNIAFTYAEGDLSGPWFLRYKAVKRKLRRVGLDVRVQLLPLTELDAHVDVLVLPEALSDRVPGSVAVGEVVLMPANGVQEDLDALVERLVSAQDLRGEHPSRTSAVHQGFRPVGQRGRVED